MNDIRVSLDTVKYSKKPEKWEVVGISNRLGSSIQRLDAADIKLFAENVGQNGMSFAPATFKDGVRKVDTFEQMQLLALDFDSGATFAEIADRAMKYDLPILFAYETLTSINQNKFRVAFLNNVPMEDAKMAEINQHALMEIFPEADKACKDVARMYFGGKNLLYFDDSIPTVDTELLLRNMTFFMKSRRGANHYKNHIRKFANKHGIKLNNKGLLDITPIENYKEDPEDLIEARPEKVGVSDSCKNGKKLPKSFIIYNNNYNKDFGEIFPNLNNNSKTYFQLNLIVEYTENSGSKANNKNNNRKDYRGCDLNSISYKCQLFKEFITGERRLHHQELFGIATNLIQVETGATVFKNALSSYPKHYDDAKLEKWDFHLRYLNENDYYPKNCNNFCPHQDSCQHTKNILTTVRPKLGAMQRVSGYEEIFCENVDEAHEDLRQKLIEAIHSTDTMWHVIKAQTALGKTEAYLNLAKELDLKFLIVVPTNILKRDVKLRADELELPTIVSPSLDEIRDELEPFVWESICDYRKAGLYSEVYRCISYWEDRTGDSTLGNYLQQLDEFRNFGGHAITTHRRFLNMEEAKLKKYDVIIIDEDIILSSIATDQQTITISTLRKILEIAEEKSSVSSQYKALMMKIKGIFKRIKNQNLFRLDAFEWNVGIEEYSPKRKKVKPGKWYKDSYDSDSSEENEESDGISTLADIPSFCWAEHFSYRKTSEERGLTEDCITFLKPFKFKDIKCIMVSATANERVCEYVFGADKVKFYECKKARLKGKLIQFYDRSMSRTYVAENPDVFDRIKKWSGFEHTITFKSYAKMANSSLWFGNLAGVDYLKGQNLNVIGTNHYPEFVYKLLPHALGLDFDHDAKMKNIPIIRNGYQFHFMTFEDEILREFHLWMVESDLEQAVGRARLLRYDCIVYLFSNFPLNQAIMKESLY